MYSATVLADKFYNISEFDHKGFLGAFWKSVIEKDFECTKEITNFIDEYEAFGHNHCPYKVYNWESECVPEEDSEQSYANCEGCPSTERRDEGFTDG